MALDLGAETWIRAGSAGLFALLGLVVLVLGRRKAGNRALGAFLIAVGTLLVVNNLFRTYSPGWSTAKLALALVTGIAGFVAPALMPSPPTSPRERNALLFAFATGTASMAILFSAGYSGMEATLAVQDAPPSFRWAVRGVGAVFFAGIGAFIVGVPARLAAMQEMDRPTFRRALALAFSFGLTWIFQFSVLNQDDSDVPAFMATVLLVVALTGLWLWIGRRGDRLALAIALVWPLLGLGAELYQMLPQNAEAAFHDAYGLTGLWRLVGWAFLAHAVFRLDLLGVPLPHFVVNRGAVAAGALATLFIVAQVAQNFFSAEYGLLTGGVMAGAFVFAASPIQRTFERMSSREPPAPRGAPPRKAMTAGKQQEDAFRGAVRLAWKDRRFDQSEELALAVLADSMGLPASRATAIRHEVEREKGVR